MVGIERSAESVAFPRAFAADPENLDWQLELLSFEPFALAVRRNDSDFRLVADAVLAQLYRSGAIEKIFARWFGANAEPSVLLQAVFFLNAYAD